MIRLEGWRYLDEELNIPFPWYTSPCLEWLKTIDLFGKKIFEYGAGDSTKWYRSQGSFVCGVDHNEQWAELAGVQFISTGDVHKNLSYVTHVLHGELVYGKFDIICIDGVLRDECIEFSLKSIKKGGFIIIDNYKQPSADLADWPITEKLIENLDVKFYKEPEHQDWQTIVIHV